MRLQQGNYEQALAIYKILTQQMTVSVEVWSSKGATLLHLGRAEEALTAYDQAIALSPHDPELWTSRANVLHDLQRNDEEMYLLRSGLDL